MTPNAHDLRKAISALEKIDGRHTSLSEAIEFFNEHSEDTLEALLELVRRRKAANDEHGCDVP